MEKSDDELRAELAEKIMQLISTVEQQGLPQKTTIKVLCAVVTARTGTTLINTEQAEAQARIDKMTENTKELSARLKELCKLSPKELQKLMPPQKLKELLDTGAIINHSFRLLELLQTLSSQGSDTEKIAQIMSLNTMPSNYCSTNGQNSIASEGFIEKLKLRDIDTFAEFSELAKEDIEKAIQGRTLTPETMRELYIALHKMPLIESIPLAQT